jgi:hypothetical protein
MNIWGFPATTFSRPMIVTLIPVILSKVFAQRRAILRFILPASEKSERMTTRAEASAVKNRDTVTIMMERSI